MVLALELNNSQLEVPATQVVEFHTCKGVLSV